MKAILASLNGANSLTFDDDFFFQYLLNGIETFGGDSVLEEVLSIWSQVNKKKIILLIDEIDALVGDTLISVLRQLRSGYAKRPHSFPQSIILCGVRDVRDYRIFSDRDQQIITGGSAVEFSSFTENSQGLFEEKAINLKAKSLTVGDFTQEEIRMLYEEHTQETGQDFEEGVFDLAWDYTRGQPWLVNALANEVCFENKTGRDRSQPITTQMFEGAKQALIARRDTHIDQLADKLKEDRVRRVIEPILEGSNAIEDVSEDDIQYCEDLGLIKRVGSLEIANEIYREVIPRSLSYATQRTIYQEPRWYVDKDGKLNMMKLLTNFQQFFREQSESWLTRFKYEEAGPQLLLQAFLQRIINGIWETNSLGVSKKLHGGGLIDRELGQKNMSLGVLKNKTPLVRNFAIDFQLGRKRTDLYIRWPIIKDRFKEEGKEHPFPLTYNPDDLQRIVIELKLKHHYTLQTVIEEGLKQTASYVNKTGAKEAYLIIFDQENPNWDEKVFIENREYNGLEITVFGM